MIPVDAEHWAQGFEEVMERIGARFGRIEPRRRARAYLRGLLSAAERKNGWQLAEVAGDRTPDGVQDFLAGRIGRPSWCATICALMWSSIWAMSRRCWCQQSCETPPLII